MWSRRIASLPVAMSSDNQTRICIPLNEKTYRALTASARKATAIADMIELRVDGLESVELDSPTLEGLIATIPRPVILTFRATEEGGYRLLTKSERRAFWLNNFDSHAAFFDIETDLVDELISLDANTQPDWSRVICSHHDFSGVPRNLTDIYEQMTFTPARTLKIAVTANDIVDCLEVFKLLERAVQEKRDVIALAMGNAGVVTRILGPSRGSFLTYGSLEKHTGTAVGQVVAADLKSIYRIDQINRDTMITGLVGLPVMHSVSPHMHNAAFKSAGLNAVYLPLEVGDLGGFFKRMIDPRTREIDWFIRGLSITAPHKTEVIKYLDWIESSAKEIGAVNTIVVENERLHGYNTDADGFLEPLLQRIGMLAGARAAVIGAGGAARAAIYALQQQSVDVDLFARNADNASEISQQFQISCKPLISAKFSSYDVVVNTTPLGSIGKKLDETPAVAEQLLGSRLAYDLVYNPIETEFLRQAREAGCEVVGGLEMLVAQAKLQFKLWTNTDTSSELMYTSASLELADNSSSRS